MHQIKSPLGQDVNYDVLSPHFYIWQSQRFEETRVNIGGENVAATSDAIGEPIRDRPTAGPYFQTVSAVCDATIDQVLGTDVVKDLGKRHKSHRCFWIAVWE